MAHGVAPDMAHIKVKLLKPRKYDNIVNFFNLNYEEVNAPFAIIQDRHISYGNTMGDVSIMNRYIMRPISY